MLRLKRPTGADDLVLEGGLAAAGNARDVALRRLLPRLQGLAALTGLDQRTRDHAHEKKDGDIDNQRHGRKPSGAKASGARPSADRRVRKSCRVRKICRVRKSAIPGPADPPPTRLWTRGLPAFRTWGTVAM